MHHHVALGRAGDTQRLYRFINGTALGLIACGGGAYCAAHIGLYKALLQAGLTFDIMGGTSGGGAMAAAFAMGTDPDDVDRAIHDIFVTNKAMRRYTWPRYSLLDHTHFDRQLANHYAGIDIEDLWIPYFAVSTNLSSYSLHRHRARRSMGRRAHRQDRCRCCCRPTTTRTGTCWSTAPSWTTCR